MFSFDGPLLKQGEQLIGLVNCSKENREWMLRALNNYDDVVAFIREVEQAVGVSVWLKKEAEILLDEIGADEATN